MEDNIYGRLMPSSKSQLNKKANDINKHLDRKVAEMDARIIEILKDTDTKVKDQFARIEQLLEKNMMQTDKKYKVLVEQIEEMKSKITSQQKILDSISQQMQLMDLQEKEILRSSSENVWNAVFHDAICESKWLEQRTFYPGRWAAGYPFLYILYRCLNEVRPKSILEMGMGQTTRLIGQYAAAEEGCTHLVTEHDEKWIDFFTKDFPLPPNTQVMKMEIKKEKYHETDEVTVYDHFKEKMAGKKFDLISIDAPFGGPTLNYSRIDILSILPQCLDKSFIILLDDYERKGEKNMVEEMKHILKKNDIEYKTGKYCGDKDTLIIISKDLGFLSSM